MNLTLHVWRQAGPSAPGHFEAYQAKDVSEHASFLEMLDLVNESLTHEGKEPIAFEHDCREGICGSCGMMINGVPHGPRTMVATCQLHMRFFKDGDVIWIEPFRATAFPVIRDLVVDRSAGSAPDANALPIRKHEADLAMDAAQCIGCGACVAACPNASAMLFTSAKVSHLGLLPQGQPERWTRVVDMIAQHDLEGFGTCTNHGACQEACPKGISVDFIARLNRDLLKSSWKAAEPATSAVAGGS
jgi:succinate dehydrogenase / fumarate reductase iron-sulfur subunit